MVFLVEIIYNRSKEFLAIEVDSVLTMLFGSFFNLELPNLLHGCN